jgi:cryptochrome 1
VITYIWAKEEEGQFQPGRLSRWWLHHSLKVLEDQIRAKGSFICYRRGPCAVDQLLDICRETGARVVFFNNVYDPLSLVRDHDVKCRLDAAGVMARSFNAELLYEPWEVVDDTGKPLTTFEGFWRKCVVSSCEIEVELRL